MNDVVATINNVASQIKPVAPALAGLMLIVIGLLYTTAKDVQKKDMYGDWMKNVGIGFAIVYLGASLVAWFTGIVNPGT